MGEGMVMGGDGEGDFLFTLSANDHIYGNGGSAQLRIPP